MTVGEKIQFYRKKIGLSQEELGQKMLVSRQTISLWEMDKTLPTIDNLVRLKELFGVSVDELLSDAEPQETREATPLESYTFQYTNAEVQEIAKKVLNPYTKRAWIIAIATAILFLFSILAKAEGVAIGFAFSLLLGAVVTCIRSNRSYRKAWKDNEERIVRSSYRFDVYDTYLIVYISKDGEVLRAQKTYFTDINRVTHIGNYILLEIAGQSFILRKDALAPNSIFFDIQTQPETSVVTADKKPKGGLAIASIVLFVLSIATLWGALIGVAILSGINQAMTENMWVFFLFLPVPIASIVFGFYLKEKGYKYKKNVIVGVIMAVLLCIYGSFTFIFSGFFSHNDEPIINAEQMLSIDIPEHSHINTQDWTKGTQSTPRGYIYSTSDIYFDDAAVEEFEKNLSSDTKWISTIPNDMVGITSYFCDIQTGDYYIIYNRDTGEFNQLPSESGTYVFINVIYNAESNTMKLVEYQIEYIK